MISIALADNLLVPVAIPALLFRCRPSLYASFPSFVGGSCGGERPGGWLGLKSFVYLQSMVFG